MNVNELQADAQAKIAEAEGLLAQAAAERKLTDKFPIAEPTPQAQPAALKTRTDPGEGQTSVVDINAAAVAAQEAKNA